MKSISVIILVFGFQFLIAQDLPQEVRFSDDGLRLVSGNNLTYGFYEDNRINTLELKFSQPDFWQQMLNNYQSKKDILATLIYDGKEYPNVGVRFKGQTSFSRVTSQKKSFNITMNLVDSTQDLKGYETLNLNNSFEDNSFMREVFYENITRPFSPSLKANWIHLKINGESWGLYPNIQALDGEYIKQWFLSNDGTRWRCERTTPTGGGGGGGFGAGTSSLNYLGEDTSLYKPHYTLKKANKPDPWVDMVNTTRALNNLPVTLMEDSLKKLLDVDRTLWFLAKEIIFGDDDSYVNKGGMDYYAYWDKETGRMIPLEYDANSVMGTMTATWTPFLKETDVRFPLMNKLFKVPAFRQRYIAHVKHVINTVLDSNLYIPKINAYYSLIDTFVQADNKKIMTYAQFTTARQTLINYLNNRRVFLLNNTEIKIESPNITYTYYENAKGNKNTPPDANEGVRIFSEATHPNGIETINLYYASGYDGYFEKRRMFDDGSNGDVTAGDGIYTGNIPGFGNGAYVRYYVEAVAKNTAKSVSFMPPGAEHDVFIYRVNLINSANNHIVINELMANNTKSVADQDGEFDDWIELFNKSDNDIDISNWVLTDNQDNLDKFIFPTGTVIPAKAYLIVWADEDGKQEGLHANFKLSASGESLLLLDNNAYLADQIIFGKQEADISFARIPNGTGPFIFQSHTFNKSNDVVSLKDEKTKLDCSVFPNPTFDILHIKTHDAHDHTLKIINLEGHILHQQNINAATTIDLQHLTAGLYLLFIDQKSIKIQVLK